MVLMAQAPLPTKPTTRSPGSPPRCHIRVDLGVEIADEAS